MKRILSMLVLLATSVPVLAGDAGTVYGAGVTEATAVAMGELLGHPDQYLGKSVRVEGVITGVCEKRGCWMQLTDADSGKGVRVKVEDGVIVFPLTAMGHRAVAQGTFEAIKLTPEQVAARKAEAEAAHKAAHDTKKEAEGEGCSRLGAPAEGEGAGCDAPVVEDTIYLLRGTGAVIY